MGARRGNEGGGEVTYITVNKQVLQTDHEVVHAHLYLSSLNHGAMESLPCLVGVSAICESYKTESLHAGQTKHAM